MISYELAAVRYPLLTSRDWEFISRIGLPAFPDASLLSQSGGNVLLTARGREFYQAALECHGIQAEVSALSYPELLKYAIAISNGKIEANRANLKHAWLHGSLPSQERAWTESYLFSPGQSREELSRRTIQSQASGPNVLPIPQKKRPRRNAV